MPDLCSRSNQVSPSDHPISTPRERLALLTAFANGAMNAIEIASPASMLVKPRLVSFFAERSLDIFSGHVKRNFSWRLVVPSPRGSFPACRPPQHRVLECHEWDVRIPSSGLVAAELDVEGR